LQLRTQAQLQQLHALLKGRPAASSDHQLSITNTQDISHGIKSSGDDTGGGGGGGVGVGGGVNVDGGKENLMGRTDNSNDPGDLGSGNSDTSSKTRKKNSIRIKPSGYVGGGCDEDDDIDDSAERKNYRKGNNSSNSKDSKTRALQSQNSGQGQGPGQDLLEELLLLLVDMRQVGIQRDVG
jgi:hypothetical protein